MDTAILQSDIIENRQKRAVRLAELASQVDAMSQALTQIATSPLSFSKPTGLQPLIEQLASFGERVARKRRLFENGMVTICIAGMEKSGKSTMLKKLTGIDLPTAQERCTSVSSNILYTDKEEGWFDIVYYTESELCQVMSGLWSYLHDARADVWSGDKLSLACDTPSTLSAFRGCNLPDTSALDPQSVLEYEAALRQLRAIKNCLMTHAAKLGSSEIEKPLSELPRYISHRTVDSGEVSEEQCLIRKVAIHAKFEHGCPALRLCDTPGVDDPNQNARDLTYRTILEESDILVVAHRPDNRPDPTKSLARFISDLRKTDPDAPLRQRTVYFVNWFKGADPDGKAADTHIAKMRDYNIFRRIYGPCDVMEPGSVSSFLKELNEFIAEQLPGMDDTMIFNMEREFKLLQSRIRIDVLEELTRQMPPLPSSLVQQLDNLYDDWFDEFYSSLVLGMDRVSQMHTLPELDAVQREIQSILKTTESEMNAWLRENATAEQCGQYLRAGREPIQEIMPQLAALMTSVVEKLTISVETLSPAIQTQVLHVIIEAMGQETAATLLPGTSDRERLSNLQSMLEKSAKEQSNEPSVSAIAKSLKEFATLHAEMGYVMRYEMRPCLNLLDHLRWRADRLQQTISRTKTLLSNDAEGIKCYAWLEHGKCPSFSDSAEIHARFLLRVTCCSLRILVSVLGSHASQLQLMVDDFLSQASQTLATQARCEKGWKRGLAPLKRTILEQETAALLSSAAEAEAYRNLQSSLEDCLN